MYVCSNPDCKKVNPGARVRCDFCHKIGVVRYVETSEIPSEVQSIVPAKPADKPVIPVKKVTATPLNNPKPAPVLIEVVVKPKPSVQLKNDAFEPKARLPQPILPARPLVAQKPVPVVQQQGGVPDIERTTYAAGVAKAKVVLDRFADEGLWIRSVVSKHVECLTVKNIVVPKADQSTGDLFCDSWSFAHNTIAQYFFRMHPDSAGRCIGLIVDWTQTDDRFIASYLVDASTKSRTRRRR